MSKPQCRISAILLVIVLSSHTLAAAPRRESGSDVFSWIKQIVRKIVPLDLADPVLPKP
jgi:hypothetical protein